MKLIDLFQNAFTNKNLKSMVCNSIYPPESIHNKPLL